MKILVTGGTGFSGKALVKRLLSGGHQVVALDYKEGVKTADIEAWGGEVVIGNVTDRAVVDRVVSGVNVVYHLAAAFREMNVPDSYYEQVNIGGTRNVLQASRAAGVERFIYCSTCGVHGNVETPPAAESAPIKPADYYQRTKYAAEPLVLAEHGREIATLVLRPAAIYGPGDPDRFGMIFRRVNKGVFPMFGDGKALYHPLYIDNFIDALESVLNPGMGDGKVYLIADEEYIEIEQLVRRVARSMNKEVRIPHYPFLPLSVAGHIVERLCRPLKLTPPIYPRRVDWYRQNRAFDIGNARRDLGYKPLVDLDEGLRRTASWYMAERYL
jgi:nucleoside-diphosphate-sugar epimerase